MSQGLAGSVSENCKVSAADGDGVGDGSACAGGTKLGSGVAPGPVVTATAEGTAEAALDDGDATFGASGVHAARTVSPAPAARKRAKVRRLGSGAASRSPEQS